MSHDTSDKFQQRPILIGQLNCQGPSTFENKLQSSFVTKQTRIFKEKELFSISRLWEVNVCLFVCLFVIQTFRSHASFASTSIQESKLLTPVDRNDSQFLQQVSFQLLSEPMLQIIAESLKTLGQ